MINRHITVKPEWRKSADRRLAEKGAKCLSKFVTWGAVIDALAAAGYAPPVSRLPLLTSWLKKMDEVGTSPPKPRRRRIVATKVDPLRERKNPTVSSVSVTSEDFLVSYKWRHIRYRALQLNRGHCECCGRRAGENLSLHVDHIKPRKTHPELALVLDNLQVLCGDCNHGKGNTDDTDWRKVK